MGESVIVPSAAPEPGSVVVTVPGPLMLSTRMLLASNPSPSRSLNPAGTATATVEVPVTTLAALFIPSGGRLHLEGAIGLMIR